MAQLFAMDTSRLRKEKIGMSHQWYQQTLLGISLVLLWVVMPVTAQEYYADDFSKDTTGNYESAGPATWTVEKGELLSRDSNDAWNVMLVKGKFWKNWTDYTYEIKVMPNTKKRGAQFIYITFRYTQKLGLDRQDFYTYLMDEANVVGLYIDRFIGGTRTRPVPGTMTFAGAWKNEEKVYEIKLEVTSKTISGYLDGKQQFKPIKDDNLIDGRIGIGIWGADANFDDLAVYGPEGRAVDPSGKVATTWGKIKAKF